jgi:CheY-like chemotaxis protein
MPNLLIVEDDLLYREFLVVALKIAGYQSYSARGGQEAIEALATFRPDVVLLDLSMPHVTGWDVFHFMRGRADLAHIPVIVITAMADEETRRQCLAERVNALLIKPLNIDEILAAVEKFAALP